VRPSLLLSIGLLSVLAVPARADLRAVTQVYCQIVAYGLPENFVAAFENTQTGFYIQEALPAGENLQDWTQMLTTTGAEGGATAAPEAQA